MDIGPSGPNVFMRRAFRYLIANEELLRDTQTDEAGHAACTGIGQVILALRPLSISVSERSVIVVDEAKAFIIQKVFSGYLLGMPVHVICQEVKKLGFTVKGNSAVQKILGNCTYAGMVKVPADAKRPERLVKALHPAIVSEGGF